LPRSNCRSGGRGRDLDCERRGLRPLSRAVWLRRCDVCVWTTPHPTVQCPTRQSRAEPAFQPDASLRTDTPDQTVPSKKQSGSKQNQTRKPRKCSATGTTPTTSDRATTERRTHHSGRATPERRTRRSNRATDERMRRHSNRATDERRTRHSHRTKDERRTRHQGRRREEEEEVRMASTDPS